MMRNQLKIQKKAVLIMLAIFLQLYFPRFIFRKLLSIFLAIYSSAALSGIVVLISGRKLLKTTKASYKKEISVFQRLASNYMFTGVLFIVLSNIVDVDECIGKVMKSTNEIFIHGNFSITEILHLAVGYLYVYSVVYGYFCYTDYKKQLRK